MKTAHLSWEEVKQMHGDHVIDVYSREGTLVRGRPETLDKMLEGCELMRLTKGVYQVTDKPAGGKG